MTPRTEAFDDASTHAARAPVDPRLLRAWHDAGYWREMDAAWRSMVGLAAVLLALVAAAAPLSTARTLVFTPCPVMDAASVPLNCKG